MEKDNAFATMENILDKHRADITKEIDEHFFNFVKEQNITDSRDPVEIAVVLSDKGLEIFNEVTKVEGANIYTFKLRKVMHIAETSIKVLDPKFEVEK